jgi:hypothetical protein
LTVGQHTSRQSDKAISQNVLRTFLCSKISADIIIEIVMQTDCSILRVVFKLILHDTLCYFLGCTGAEFSVPEATKWLIVPALDDDDDDDG